MKGRGGAKGGGGPRVTDASAWEPMEGGGRSPPFRTPRLARKVC